MEGIYFTPYKVSTITCNVDIGVNVDLITLYEKFQIGGKSKFIWIYYPKIIARGNGGIVTGKQIGRAHV